MNKLRQFIPGVCLVFCVCFISACGPSQESKTKSATQAALWKIATQTAAAPTSTKTPTSTSTPTATPLPTPTPTLMVGLITFDSDREFSSGAFGIYAMNRDGQGEELLFSISPGYGDMFSSWSPDGKRIAFYSYRNGENADLFMINADGTQLTQITDTPIHEHKPSWSPDGSQLVFLSSDSRESETHDITLMNVDGSGLFRLTGNAGDDPPCWSPDGKKIAFSADAGGGSQIFTINLDGTELTQLTDDYENIQPDWSPDGKSIVFASLRENFWNIYVINADGGGEKQITHDKNANMSPDYSPDGGYIAFEKNRSGNSDIYVMKVDGSNTRQLTNDPAGDYVPRWSPEGVEISDDPWFGPPFCLKDIDGDFQADQYTTTFTTDESFAYVAFPFRNMKDGMDYSIVWDLYDLSVYNSNSWDQGESGWQVEMGSIMLNDVGTLTITLTIEGRQIQQIKCEVVKP